MTLDPRGARFAAAITSVVIVVVLLTGSGWLALAQAGGALGGVLSYIVFSRFPGGVHDHGEGEGDGDGRAPWQSWQVLFLLEGSLTVVVAAVGYLTGATPVGVVTTGLALVAAFLNAAFGYCLGCEVYLLGRRLAHANRRTS